MRKLIIVISIIVILGLSFLLMNYFNSLKELPTSTEAEKAAIYVKATPVVYEEISPVIVESGRLGSYNTIEVISEVQGEILNSETPLNKGQNFKKGDLLIRIFNEEAVYNLKASKSRFLNLVANLLPDFKIDYPENYQRWLDFFNSIKIDKPLPELPEISSAQQKIFLASRNILNDYFLIKASEIRLSKYEIHAPFNGAYTEVMLELGSIANIGSRIARIIRTDELELEIPIQVDEISWIKIGDKAIISSEQSDEKLKGKVVRIADYVNRSTQSISVFISVRSTKRTKLYEGLYLTAEFTGKPLDFVMEMPRNAIFNTNEVFTVVHGKLKVNEIDIIKINEKTLLFSGLDEGEELVIIPIVNVEEGDVVEIIR